MDNTDTIFNTIMLITILVFILIVIAIIFGIILLVKHLIKFTTRTIYEEKARAEERHRQDYDPERDR